MQLQREYNLTIKMGKKSRSFVFLQATAYQTIQFIEESKQEGFSPVLWCYTFLNEQCKSPKRFFTRKNVTLREFRKFWEDFVKIFDIITKKWLFWSFEEKKDTDTPEKPEDVEDTAEMPFDAYLAMLSERFSIDPLEMLKKYTFEQIRELGKGMVYLMNMQTEEWRKKNEVDAIREKMKGVDKDVLKKQFERLNSYHQK